MAQDYIFNGQTFTLDDGLSENQAREVIQNYLKTQEDENKISPSQTFSAIPEETKSSIISEEEKPTQNSLQASQILTKIEEGEIAEKKKKRRRI